MGWGEHHSGGRERDFTRARATKGNAPKLTKWVCREDIPANEGFPVRQWSIRVFVLGPDGEELAASLFDKVTYKLHPTFANPTRGTVNPLLLLLSPLSLSSFYWALRVNEIAGR